MTNSRGRIERNTLLTQGDMLCVAGDRKWTLRTMTVTMMERVTRIMVNRRYFPMRGTTMEVGGMISASRRKNTVSDRRMEIHRVIFSPESEGR